MKKAFRLIGLVLAAIMFSGCIPHTELDEKAIILAIGIDYEDGEYSVTYQHYSPTGLGGQTLVDNSQPNVLTSSGKGKDVYEALEDASVKCGCELMLGVTQIIIIGEEAAKNSVEDVTDFSRSFFQCHPDMLIAVAEGKAEDYMQVKFSEGIVSTQKLKYLLNNAESRGWITLPSALDLFIALQTQQQSACLPRFTLIEDGKSDSSEDGKSIEIGGGVLLKNGKAQDNTDMDTMKGLQLIDGCASETTVTFDHEGEMTSVGLIGIKREIVPVYEEEKLIFQVKLTSGGKYFTTPSEGFNAENNRITEQECAAKLIEIMQKAAESTVQKYGADPINLERTVRHHDYKLWQKLSEDWEETLKSCEFRFTVEVNMDRLALTE